MKKEGKLVKNFTFLFDPTRVGPSLAIKQLTINHSEIICEALYSMTFPKIYPGVLSKKKSQ